MKIAIKQKKNLIRNFFSNSQETSSVIKMNSKKNVSSSKKKSKSIQKTKKSRSIRQKPSRKNKSLIRRSKRLIEKQKQKEKKCQQSFKAQNQTQPQKKSQQKSNKNIRSHYKSKQTKSVSKLKSLSKKQSPKTRQKIRNHNKAQTQRQKQQSQDKIYEEEDQKKQFLYNNTQACNIEIPQSFEHQYISSTTPIASQIRNNSTQIHSHTDRTQRNHSQSAAYYQYHITFRLMNYQNPVDYDILSQKIDEIDNQLDERHNILVTICWRNLQDSQVLNLRKQAQRKNRRLKIRNNEEERQKQRKKSFDGIIMKVLNSKHVPEFIEHQNKQNIDLSKINKSAFKPVVRLNDQSQGVMKLYYFLFRNKQRITVGRSVRYEKGRPLRQISYLKIDPSNKSKMGDQDLNVFLCKQPVYISFDFEKDHTQNVQQFSNQDMSQNSQQSQQNDQKQNWKIGMIEFDHQIPKRIFQKIVKTQYLRSQFYVNQITIESKRSNAKSIFENDISSRHPINFAQLFKYIRKIKVQKMLMKKGAQIYLKQIKVNLTFTKLQILRIGDLEILQPLQFIEFQCLQSIEFEGRFIHNLRSLRKLNLKSQLQKISLNKSLSLLQRLVIVQQRAVFNDFQYTAGHLRSLPEINFDPYIIYENPEDKMIPIELAAKMGLKTVFKEDDHHMLPSVAQYNQLYLKQYEVHELVNEILGVLNRRMF